MDSYSLDSYREMFGRLGRSVQNTIIIPGVAIAITVLMAVLMAYLSVRRSNPLSKTVDTLSIITGPAFALSGANWQPWLWQKRQHRQGPLCGGA